MVQAPAKARSDIEILVEKFNKWAEDRIVDLQATADNQFFSDGVRSQAQGGIGWLESAKKNLKRLAEEISNETVKIPSLQ